MRDTSVSQGASTPISPLSSLQPALHQMLRREKRGQGIYPVDPNTPCQDRLLPMDFDDQLRRFFGTDDLGTLTPAALAGGVEHMRVEFGLEKDKDRRFAMWTILYMLSQAPDLDVAFKDPADRDAARNFMDLLDKSTSG